MRDGGAQRRGTHLRSVTAFHGLLTAELTARQADWQLHAYGHAMHAFMAPFADDPERGIRYATVARRAWASTLDFLAETFA